MEDILQKPILTITITVFTIILTACLFKKIMSSTDKRKKLIYHPVVGTILDQFRNFDRLHHYFAELATKNKTFRMLSLFHSKVYTADPANVEYFLKTNFPNYGKGKFQHSILSDLLGDGIFTVDGEKWQKQRKTASHEFSTRNLRDFSSGVFKNVASKLALLVSQAASANQIIEVQDMFMKATIDSVFKVVLGVDLGTINGGTKEEQGVRFARCFDEASELTMHRYVVDPLWKILRLLNIGPESRLKKNIKVIDDFVYKIIKNKTEQVQKPQEYGTVKREDILSRFLEMNETDPKYLKDIILSFIIAGKDTTASTLSWFFYLMCKHPHLQEKLAQEVTKATKINNISCSISELAESVTEEALSEMQYLHAALTETLRLYPAIPADEKVCFEDDTLPDGFRIRKGSTIAYIPWAMGRMKYIWGDDAEEFKPERWLDEDGVFQQQSSFKFTAFQAGPRICLGKEFAYRQMKIFSAVLFGSFIFELSDEQKKKQVNYKTMLTLHIDGGVRLTAHPRLKQ